MRQDTRRTAEYRDTKATVTVTLMLAYCV